MSNQKVITEFNADEKPQKAVSPTKPKQITITMLTGIKAGSPKPGGVKP